MPEDLPPPTLQTPPSTPVLPEPSQVTERQSAHSIKLGFCIVSVPEHYVVNDVDFQGGVSAVDLYSWDNVKRERDLMTFQSWDAAKHVLDRILREPAALWCEWRHNQWLEIKPEDRPTLAIARAHFEVWYETQTSEDA